MADIQKGRPKIDVSKQHVEFLRSLAFQWHDVAGVLGISTSTLYRRVKDWGIPKFSPISDEDLDGKISQFRAEFPNTGEAVTRGHLESQGIHVARQRMRDSVWRLFGRQDEHRLAIQRRSYCVSGPNALWHIDGNHKLIKWRLVIHGGIDGFSRLVTFLKCSNNNRSDTVLSAFTAATTDFGVPSRVRSDHGGENVRVWDFMEEARGFGRSSYIAGSSTHNTRIERLWRDVYIAVTSTFVGIFQSLEDVGHLDPLNEADMFCLHYVYIPRINAALDVFKRAWNFHPLSTEGNKSPIQLFTSNITLDDYDIDITGHYGTDPDAPGPEDDDLPVVHVPETRLRLLAASLMDLQSTVNPVADSEHAGVDLYLSTATKSIISWR